MSRGLKWTARAAAGVLLLLGCGFAVFANAIERAPPASSAPADAIIVLTGGDERIDVALQLLAERRGKRLLISGVNPKTSRSELQRHSPLNAALFDCCVDIGYWAQDTPGNADEARAWINAKGFTSAIIVTSSYHMPRSLLELRRAMPGITLIPHPVIPARFKIESWWTNPGTARLMVTEYVKLIPSAARLVAAMLLPGDDGTGGQAALADPAPMPKL
jgi:uncharacterized SAM-binding protein YcdF (DUF218 family)